MMIPATAEATMTIPIGASASPTDVELRQADVASVLREQRGAYDAPAKAWTRATAPRR